MLISRLEICLFVLYAQLNFIYLLKRENWLLGEENIVFTYFWFNRIRTI
jgi:hypothetical protein